MRQVAEDVAAVRPQKDGPTMRDTKVNRSITEGRRAFLDRVARIEAGDECERHVPLLSALADGEASAEDLAALRPHLKTCLSCRARLREFRAAPARVAALLPPVALGAGHGGGALRSWFESLADAAQHKAAAAGDRIHSAVELATGQKVAAVAASAAALAGGGATIDKLKQPPARAPVDQRQAAQPVERRPSVQPVAQEPAQAAPAPVAQSPPPVPKPAPPPPDPANEFAPAAAPVAPARAAPAGGPARAGGGGGSEFGP